MSRSGLDEILTTAIADLTAVELLQLYRHKRLSPVEATAASLARIEQHNAAVNAYCHVDPEGAMASARASEKRWMSGAPCGSLDGVPASIKDLTLTKGMPTRMGSRTTSAEGPWRVDAPFTARMSEAGAVLLGKTTTPEFGWKGVTDSPLTGITRNPWNVAMTAGGSSGGAAAAAALNMGVLHQGSDAGGSIRIPAAFCGVFGLKPTFGHIPQWPASAMTTLSHLGPMTRSVEDAALMMNVVAQTDDRDWYAGPGTDKSWDRGINTGVRGLRIAYSRNLGYVSVDPEVASAVEHAVSILAGLGAQVEEVDPGFEDPIESFNTLWFAGAAKLVDGLTEQQRQLLDPGFIEIAARGREISLVDYLHAQDARACLGEAMSRFHHRYDLLLTPSVPITAFAAGSNVAVESQKDWMDWTPFSYPFNLTQQPAATVPCGLSTAGLPIGLQVVGPKFGDDLVLRACQVLSQAWIPSYSSLLP
ncbi:MAG: aspartyl-tRNA(Asn)/glutamyl-tRNA(Gln) amidotransferase subunit A [Motiliproteus sp.]|jgi:aspartyl-tRNA(Asn)/glutamyl-tRNA(Gln) amidotransferase subunit A